MLAGIAMSNSILIVEFAHHLLEEGLGVREAIVTACRVRLRSVLMTSLGDNHWTAADGFEAGRRKRIPRAAGTGLSIGGLTVSRSCSLCFWCGTGFYVAYGKPGD